MKKAITLVTAMTLVIGFSLTQSVAAQDFSQLMGAVDKLETTLKKMVESESRERKQEMAELRQIVEQIPAGTAGTGDRVHLTQLALDVKALRAEFDLLKKTQAVAPATESDLLTVIEEVQYLRSEVELLRAMTGKTRQQLASIDEDGFYVPPENNPKVAELTRRLTELNTSLEDVLARPSNTESNPSVNHGKIALGGFVHEHFISGPDETSSFVSKRARLTVKGDINDYAQIKIQSEFAKSPKLLDGQLTISPHQQWSLSMGQYKPPFGTDFLISATSTPFVNRSMATGLTTNRDVGATVSFRKKFSPDYSLKLTTGLFNGSGINTSDANNTKNFVARAEITLGGMFTIAPNVYYGKTNQVDSLKEDLADFGGSLTWKWHREIVETEYIHSKHGDTKRAGWYVWGGHMFSIGTPFLRELQLLARYEQHDPDAGAPDDRTDRLTIGTNLFVDRKYTKIQLNYQINGEQGASVDDNEFLMNVQVAF